MIISVIIMVQDLLPLYAREGSCAIMTLDTARDVYSFSSAQ